MPKDKKTGNEKISYDNEYLEILINTAIMQKLDKSDRDEIEKHIRDKDKSTAETSIRNALTGIGSSVDALNDELEDIDEDYSLKDILSQAIRIESNNSIQSRIRIRRGGVDAILDKELTISTRDISFVRHVESIDRQKEQSPSQSQLISIRFVDSDCRAEMRLDKENTIQSFNFYNNQVTSVMSDSFESLFAHVNRSQPKRIEVKPRDSHGHETPLFDEGVYDLSFKSSEKLSQNMFQKMGNAIQTLTSRSDAKSRDARAQAQHCETYLMKHHNRMNFFYTLKIYTEKSNVLAVDVVCKNARTSWTRKVTLDDLNKVSWFDDRHRVEPDAVFLRESTLDPKQQARLKKIKAIHDKREELVAHLANSHLESDLIDLLNQLTIHHQLIDKKSISQVKKAEIDKLTASNKLRSDPKVTQLLKGICVLYKGMKNVTPESILIQSVLDAGYKQVIPKDDAIKNLNTLRILEETFEHVDRLNGKDLIMFLGNTGAGKSTSINYFSGVPLREVKTDHGEMRLIIDEKKRVKKKIKPEHCAKIGSSLGVSETVHVQGYPIVKPPKKPEKGDHSLDYPGTLLCDTPGFRDTRGTDYQLSAKVSIEQAVRGARNIRAIVLTLPYGSFLNERAIAVVELMKDLEQRVPDILDDTSLNASIFLLITKHSVYECPEKGIDHILNQLHTEAQNELRNSTNKRSDELTERRRRVAIWTLLQRMKNQGRVCFIDATSRMSRANVLRSYMQARQIPKVKFSRFLDREDCDGFRLCIQLIANSYLKSIMEPFLTTIPEEIQKSEQKIKDEEEKICELKKQKIRTKSKIQEVEKYAESLEAQLADLKNRTAQSSDKMDAKLKQQWQEIAEKSKQEVTERRQRNIAQYKEDIARQKIWIGKKEKAITKLQVEIAGIEKDIKNRENEIRDWKIGSDDITLWCYRERSTDEKMNLQYLKKDALENATLELRYTTEDEVERRECVTAGEYRGKLTHQVLIERKYRVIPRDEEHKSRFLSGKSAGGYTAIMKGHKMVIHPNYQPNATSDGQKMIYTMLSTWDGEQPLPHGEIVHKMPRHEIYSASIVNAQGEIISLTRALSEKRADLVSAKENEKTENETLKQLQKQLSDEIEKAVTNTEDNLTQSREDVKKSKNDLGKQDEKIAEARKVIKATQEKRLFLQWKRRRLALILKCQGQTFQLLKNFVDFMLDKNSGMNTTSLSQTQGQARQLEKQCENYKKCYDANILELKKAYEGKGVLEEKIPEMKAGDTNRECQQETRACQNVTTRASLQVGLFTPHRETSTTAAQPVESESPLSPSAL